MITTPNEERIHLYLLHKNNSSSFVLRFVFVKVVIVYINTSKVTMQLFRNAQKLVHELFIMHWPCELTLFQNNNAIF